MIDCDCPTCVAYNTGLQTGLESRQSIRMKPPYTISMTVTEDGDFTVLEESSVYEGKFDRDTAKLKWRKGFKPKDDWTSEAIKYAVSYLVGLTPRGER